MDTIVAARALREDAIAMAAVDYRIRTPDTDWREGFWASSPTGDVHALGPLPPHALFERRRLWPVTAMTHEVRHSPTERIWARENLETAITEVAIEPGATTMRERLAGHPLAYDLVVDRWLESDKEILVKESSYYGQPAAYVRTAYGNEAWLLRDYEWAVAELREWTHAWVVKASGFDRVPLIEGAAPQRLRWLFKKTLVLEIELSGWTPPRDEAVYWPDIRVGSGELHVADRRVSPAAMLEFPDLPSLNAYLAGGAPPAATAPAESTEQPDPDEDAPERAERIVFVIDAAGARKVFSLNDMPWMKYGVYVDESGEHFGYLVAKDPRMKRFSVLEPGDVILTVDGEEWRPETDADLRWLLGRFTWMALWDRPFVVTVLRDGKLLEYEFLWSYDEVPEAQAGF